MQYAICFLSVAPLRKEPNHRSEMTSQLLLGECMEVLQQRDGWLWVRCLLDKYEGWLEATQAREITADEVADYHFDSCGIALDLVSAATSSERSVLVLAGSNLPNYDGINFRLCKEKFIYNGQAFQHDQQRAIAMLEKIALRYLHVPYLWGGRSPMGIDCSGLVQIVFKCIGKPMPRDAYQQAKEGVTLNFIEEAQMGDLAFFNNNEGRIVHVGIIMKERQILHASGRVRLDPIDHFGIFHPETKKYSHQLKVIKRVL